MKSLKLVLFVASILGAGNAFANDLVCSGISGDKNYSVKFSRDANGLGIAMVTEQGVVLQTLKAEITPPRPVHPDQEYTTVYRNESDDVSYIVTLTSGGIAGMIYASLIRGEDVLDLSCLL